MRWDRTGLTVLAAGQGSRVPSRASVPVRVKECFRSIGNSAPQLPTETPRMNRVLAYFLVFLAFTPAALADDLVAKRATCSELARDRIGARGKANSEIYRMLVERRKIFVQKCMAETDSSAAMPKQPSTTRQADAQGV